MNTRQMKKFIKKVADNYYNIGFETQLECKKLIFIYHEYPVAEQSDDLYDAGDYIFYCLKQCKDNKSLRSLYEEAKRSYAFCCHKAKITPQEYAMNRMLDSKTTDEWDKAYELCEEKIKQEEEKERKKRERLNKFIDKEVEKHHYDGAFLITIDNKQLKVVETLVDVKEFSEKLLKKTLQTIKNMGIDVEKNGHIFVRHLCEYGWQIDSTGNQNLQIPNSLLTVKQVREAKSNRNKWIDISDDDLPF